MADEAELAQSLASHIVHAGLSSIAVENIATLALACLKDTVHVVRHETYQQRTTELALSWIWAGWESGVQPFGHAHASIPTIPARHPILLYDTVEWYIFLGRSLPIQSH